MRFSTAFSFALVILPALQEVSGAIFPRQRQGKGDKATSASTPAASATPVADTGAISAAKGANGDPQKSLALDPKVIAAGFAQNGQDPPVAGQVASLTSTNNFINFCLTVNLPITNGQQIQTGSCNPAPIGVIPSVDNMPSAKFVFPKNGASVPANQAFTLQISIKNLATGNFVNAQKNYFAAPQQLQGGVIKGHSHAVIEKLTAIDQTTPTNPREFAFFKGLNAAAQGGILTADVTNGVPAGAYRVCTINTASNHQPAIVPIAQHGALDDCSYFTATAGGAPAPAPGTPTDTGVPTATTSAAATGTGDAKGKGKGKGGR